MLLVVDPLSKSVAVSEMLIILIVAAIIGWLLGRWLTNGKINQLQEELSSIEADLNDCRQTKAQQVATAPAVPMTASASQIVPDNLKIIEGIGPKIEQLLHEKGVLTFSQLASTSPLVLNEFLRSAGPRFQVHDASSWPKQAELARDQKWEELQALQDRLLGGRSV